MPELKLFTSIRPIVVKPPLVLRLLAQHPFPIRLDKDLEVASPILHATGQQKQPRRRLKNGHRAVPQYLAAAQKHIGSCYHPRNNGMCVRYGMAPLALKIESSLL